MTPRDAAKTTKRAAAPRARKSTKSRAKNLPRSETPAKTGRPQVAIDVGQLETLAKIGCTYPEMAAVLRVSEDTLTRRFAAKIKGWHEAGRSSLRRAQWKAALSGDRTMLVWLGKQELGQRDKADSRVEVADVRKLSDEELEAEAKAMGLA